VSPWVFEVIYINRSKLLVRNAGIATSAEMAEMAYQGRLLHHRRYQGRGAALITHLAL